MKLVLTSYNGNREEALACFEYIREKYNETKETHLHFKEDGSGNIIISAFIEPKQVEVKQGDFGPSIPDNEIPF